MFACILFPLVIAATSCFALDTTESLNFLVVGDWGGKDSSPYYTGGQLASVAGMEKIAQKINSEFVIALGDNFYSNGVRNENDNRFDTSFDSVYTPVSLRTNWYVIAGNHDHSGNVTAQIEYSSHNSRWKFPDFYHSHSHTTSDGTTVDIILIDTVILASLSTVQKDQPGYFDPLVEVPRAYGNTQWTWIEDQLKNSKANYILVGGHYPVYSVCKHGPTATLVTNLKPLLEKYNAHYMAGHDHCMEHIQETGSKINYYVVGMGEECCYDDINLPRVPTGSVQWYVAANNALPGTTAGFSSVTATAKSLQMTFYDQAGKVLYVAPAVSPRTQILFFDRFCLSFYFNLSNCKFIDSKAC